MLGTKVSMPIYITATALGPSTAASLSLTDSGKLGHVEGEVVLTRAAKAQNIIQMIPTLASCSFDEIADAARGGQTQWLQLCACAILRPC